MRIDVTNHVTTTVVEDKRWQDSRGHTAFGAIAPHGNFASRAWDVGVNA